MTAPWAAPARSRWFDRPPPADETPVEAALRRDLLAAVEWAEGLVQIGWSDGARVDEPGHGLHRHDGLGERGCRHRLCKPVYVVREAR